MPLPSRHRSPFVDRVGALASLDECWRRAVDGAGQFVFVSGEPGVGKTRLAAELAGRVAEAGATVLSGNCDEDPISYYQPFLQAVHALPKAPDPRRLVVALPAESVSSRHQVFHAVTTLIVESAEAAPVLLVLDDLHWADHGTLLLTRHLARSLAKSPVLVLGTYSAAGVDRHHPLSGALATLRREASTTRLTLTPFGAADVGDLLEARFGDDVDEEIVAAFYEATGGLPLFVEDLVDEFERRGARPASGREVAAAGVPEATRDVILRRIARLPDEIGAVVAAAAVVGGDLATLERACGLEPEVVLTALERAAVEGILAEVPGRVGRYVFVHEWFARALHDELSRARRAYLQARAIA